MAAFLPGEQERLDYRLLQNGAVHLYFQRSILDDDTAWLRANGYDVRKLLCTWDSETAMPVALRDALGFPPYYGSSLDAIADGLSELPIDGGGLTLVLDRFDVFFTRFPRPAHALLDIIEVTSRRHMLLGERLLALVQSDDPEIALPAVGAVNVAWNPREWAPVNRGLGHPHG